jgi:hypothetical protein
MLFKIVIYFGMHIYHGKRQTELRTRSKNLTNEEYNHFKFDLVNLFGMLQDFKGEARQVGLDFRYEF